MQDGPWTYRGGYPDIWPGPCLQFSAAIEIAPRATPRAPRGLVTPLPKKSLTKLLGPAVNPAGTLIVILVEANDKGRVVQSLLSLLGLKNLTLARKGLWLQSWLGGPQKKFLFFKSLSFSPRVNAGGSPSPKPIEIKNHLDKGGGT
jgi:hypothetical protein